MKNLLLTHLAFCMCFFVSAQNNNATMTGPYTGSGHSIRSEYEPPYYVLRDDQRHIHTRNSFGVVYNENSTNNVSWVDFESTNNQWEMSDFIGSNQTEQYWSLEAHLAATHVYDFFKEEFGWNGPDDNNLWVNIHCNVDYLSSAGLSVDQAVGLQNGEVFVGKKVVHRSLVYDVVNHEVGHIYSKYFFGTNVGILGEGLADIIQAVVNIWYNQKFANNNANVQDKDPWVFIEENPHEFRRKIIDDLLLFNSTAYNNASRHNKSIVVSHWFYQLVDGSYQIGLQNALTLLKEIGDEMRGLSYGVDNDAVLNFAAASIRNSDPNDRNNVLSAWEHVGVDLEFISIESLTSQSAVIDINSAFIIAPYDIYLNDEPIIMGNANNAYTLTGLTENKCYEVRVESSGFDSNTYLTVYADFTTLDNALTQDESFESTPYYWNNVLGDDIDWSLHSGATPSLNTGPSSADHCDHFYYLENNPPLNAGDDAFLQSPTVWVPPAGGTLTFYYHMYGADMGTLKLQSKLYNSNFWITLWSKTGDQGSVWKSASVSLSAYKSKQADFRFVGVTGNGDEGDMAVDQIVFNLDQGIVFTRQSIKENQPSKDSEDVSLDIYPNPVDNTLFKNSNKGYEYTIFDIGGKLIDRGYFKEKLEVNSLKPGVYYLKVLDQIESKTFKFIKD